MIVIKLDFSLGNVEVLNQPEEIEKQRWLGHVDPGLFRHGHVRPRSGPERHGTKHGLPRCLVDHHTIHDRGQAHPLHCGAFSELQLKMCHLEHILPNR